MNSSFYLALLVLPYIYCSADEYYVTNSDVPIRNLTCSVEGEILYPCGTLESLVNKTFSENTSINFIHSYYFIKYNYYIKFSDSTSVVIKPWTRGYHASLVCEEGDISFEFDNVKMIILDFVEFRQCGKTNAIVRVTENGAIETITVGNTAFISTSYKSVEIWGCTNELHILNCRFESNSDYGLYINNTSMSSLNIYQITSTAVISNTVFVHNQHGALYLTFPSLHLSIVDCNFQNNSAESGNSAILIINYPSIALKGIYYKEKCTSYSAAIPSPSLTVNNCIFENNKGPGIETKGNCHININVYNSTFQNNHGTSLSTDSNNATIIKNCSFYNNRAVNGAALSVIEATSVTIEESIFLGNNALEMGGAIIIRHTQIVDIKYCHFENNSAHSGGALYMLRLDAASMTHSSFNFNSAIKSNTKLTEGGALLTRYICHALLDNCSFSHNYAAIGGAINTNNTEESYNCTYQLSVTNSYFLSNSATQDGGAISVDSYSILLNKTKFSQNYASSEAGAVKLVSLTETGKDGKTGKVSITYCNWTNNSASKGGAMTIRFARNRRDNDIYLNSLILTGNRASVIGGGIYILRHFFASTIAKITITNSVFQGNKASCKLNKLSRGGAIAIITRYKIRIRDCNITNNNALTFGGGLYVGRQVFFTCTNCIFNSNEAKRGGAINIYIALVELSNTVFNNNKAVRCGGGIYMLNSNLNISGSFCKFYNNSVLKKNSTGGAICINELVSDCIRNSCILSWDDNVKIYFQDNSAVTGPSMYGGMLDRCLRPNNKSLASLARTDILVDGKQYDYKSLSITSRANKICYCHNQTAACSMRQRNINLYLGQNYTVSVACFDQMDQLKSCDIKSTFYLKKISNCENLTFRPYSSQKEETITKIPITSDVLCNSSTWNTVFLNIKLLQCPKRFEKENDQCQCDRRVKKVFPSIDCDINFKKATKVTGWLSYNGGYLRVNKYCPLNYCSHDSRGISLTEYDAQCANNHAGILCGGCFRNYSIGIGSWKCMDCSHFSKHNYIWLTVLLALAGVVLVVFLLLVKMTVSSGTTNGLILYANILSFSGLLDHHTCSIHPVLRVFLSWINLDLGIEVCYYSGMDVYQKTWLQFVFPFYIWFLVGVIILFCHYSSRVMKLMGMRNIEVLATLFLLSYAKLLKTIVTAFSFTDLLVAAADNVTDPLVSERVWVYNGHIKYLRNKHIPLFIVSLSVLLFLFLPYTGLLLFGQCLTSLPVFKRLRCFNSTTFTAIMDAYHAPYTKPHRYWTGLCLLIRCCLFTVFGLSYSLQRNLFWIALAMSFIVIIKLCTKVNIYKAKLCDVLETFFLVNLGIVATVMLCNEGECEKALITSTSLSMVVMLAVILYHIHLEIKKNTPLYINLMKKIQVLITYFKGQSQNQDTTEPNILDGDNTRLPPTYFELRESLLDD